jgi:glutamate-1-semialdehyde 2,1-aminomutase
MQRIVERYAERTPGSAALHARARRSMPGGDTRTIVFFAPHPLYIERAAGAVMADVDGNDYLDFLGNYTSLVHGHAHPAIVEAISVQAARGTAHAAGSEAAVELAETIVDRVPSVNAVRFANSGTEAVIHAIRAARAFTGRSIVVKFEGGYHGSSDTAEISVDPDPAEAGPAAAPVPVPEGPGIPSGVVDDVVIAPYNDLVSTEAVLDRHAGRVAVVIVEPMLGAAGAIPAEPGFLRGLRELCDRHGAVLVFDEVITFRLAAGGLQSRHGVRPDLTTFGKIIGGGLPVGAFGGRTEIMDLFAPPGNVLVQSGTFNANALTMAAGRAAMRLLTPGEIDRINRLGERLASGLGGVLHEAGLPAQVTGTGSIRSIHLSGEPVTDYRSKARGDSRPLRLLHLALLAEGVFAAPRGMFVTSTAMSERTIDECLERFSRALAAVRSELAAVTGA